MNQAKETTMGGVKGNDGKAARLQISTQFLIFFVFAAVAVGGVKTFGSGKWHAAATMDDQQHHASASSSSLASASGVNSASVANAAVAKGSDEQDRNMIQFVFSNLDGEDGREGEVIVKLHPKWSPIGVERIQDLTSDSFWDGCRAFRVLPNFVVQLGINGDPEKQKKWRKNIEDDPVKASNTRGTVTFAMAGKGTRTTQIFFNKVDNSRLDKEAFAPFGEVISGMDIIDRIYAGYQEKPDQGFIQQKGNSYLEKNFPKMSYIKTAKFMPSTATS